MSLALYRKYRPQTWAELIGQNHIKITLQHELELDKVAQAYLFYGPRGVGKTTTARLLAKSINCLGHKKGISEPDNSCEVCQEINANRAIDIIEIDAATHTQVDKTRENIIENARFTPSHFKYKVFIIDEVHMLSGASFNALLKTLEEPPSHVIFILATTQIHKVPETIISRCQRFDFRRVNRADLLQRLQTLVKAEKKQVAPEVLEIIIRQAEGCIRDAESLLAKVLSLGDKVSLEEAALVIPKTDFNLVCELLNHLAQKDTAQALTLVNRLVQEGVNLMTFVEDLTEVLRKILLVKANKVLGESSQEFEAETEKIITKLSQKLSYPQILAWLEIFVEARLEIRQAQIPQLPLELAVIKICESDKVSPPAAGKDTGQTSQVSLTAGQDNKTPLKAEVKSKVTLKKVLESWAQFIEEVTPVSFPLASLLKLSQPLQVKGARLTLAVSSKFYQERLTDIKNKLILAEATQKFWGEELNFIGEIKEKIKPLKITEDKTTEVESVIRLLGGEAVE